MIVQRGTLKVGSTLVVGTTFGKVRQIFDEQQRILKEAFPSMAVEVIGWKDLPKAGEDAIEVEGETSAKVFVENALKKEKLLKDIEAEKLVSLRQINNLQENTKEKEFLFKQKRGLIPKSQRYERDDYQEGQGEMKFFNAILKGDVMGTVEALTEALSKQRNEEIEFKTIQEGVGPVSESDIDLASTSDATIIAFNLKTPKAIKDYAKRKKVTILEHRVIYHLIDEVQDLMGQALPPVKEKAVIGEAKVMQIFDISVKGKSIKVAGCRVIKGNIQSTSSVMLKRTNQLLFEGKIKELRVIKDVVSKVEEGNECGIMLEGFDELGKGDLIQAYDYQDAKRTFTPDEDVE